MSEGSPIQKFTVSVFDPEGGDMFSGELGIDLEYAGEDAAGIGPVLPMIQAIVLRVQGFMLAANEGLRKMMEEREVPLQTEIHVEGYGELHCFRLCRYAPGKLGAYEWCMNNGEGTLMRRGIDYDRSWKAPENVPDSLQ